MRAERTVLIVRSSHVSPQERGLSNHAEDGYLLTNGPSSQHRGGYIILLKAITEMQSETLLAQQALRAHLAARNERRDAMLVEQP